MEREDQKNHDSTQTLLNVVDNSRAKILMCIRILRTGHRQYALIGAVIITVIKKAMPHMSIERSKIIRAVIVRTRKELKCDNDMRIRYDDNVAVVIEKKGNPKGTRIFGAIPEELRKLRFTQIISLALEVF